MHKFIEHAKQHIFEYIIGAGITVLLGLVSHTARDISDIKVQLQATTTGSWTHTDQEIFVQDQIIPMVNDVAAILGHLDMESHHNATTKRHK